MSRFVCLLVVALAGDASGQVVDENVPEPGDPLLLPPLRDAHTTLDERGRWRLRLGPLTTAALEGEWWQNEDGALPAVGVRGRGWSAAARLTQDLGFARLELVLEEADVETQLGAGRYVDAALTLRRSFRISRWSSFWISLGLGGRRWLSAPVRGEPNGGAFMLRVGGTFR